MAFEFHLDQMTAVLENRVHAPGHLRASQLPIPLDRKTFNDTTKVGEAPRTESQVSWSNIVSIRVAAS
jgi:hypothetical protein